jgi:hypothetical protein
MQPSMMTNIELTRSRLNLLTSHKDRSLSRVEFLHYEETGLVWRLAQLNEQAFQNRLRHSDYVKMIADARFRIILAEGEPDGKCLRDLE